MVWMYLIQGMAYGAAAGSQPGPFQTYLISHSLSFGWKRTLSMALAPLISDGPIILLSILVLNQIPVWMQKFLYIAGGLFVLYLSYGAFHAWRTFHDFRIPAQAPGHQSIFRAALTNALSPGAYLYWTLVTGPILVRGWHENFIHGTVFLFGFYTALISCLAAIILVFGAAGRLGNVFNRALLGISAIALFGFAVYQLWLGIFSG